MKKTLFLLLAMVLSSHLLYSYDFVVDGLAYRINSDGTSVTVTRGAEVNGVLVIPETVNYNSSGSTYSVTVIGDYAFSGYSRLTSIDIPNSVISIGAGAFSDCSGLTELNVPNSVTSVGGSAFSGTAWYNNQPDGLVYAGLVAYKYKGVMHAVTAIEINDGTVGIASRCFDGCSGLTSATIPHSVTVIGDYAFSGCSGLTSIDIPNSVISIGAGAFYGCSSLTELNVPNSVTSVGGSAFSGTAWYNNQPDGLMYVGLVAYKYKGTMPAGTNIQIEDGTTEITSNCFASCSGLTSATIPHSVTVIGDYAFSGCSGLTSIDIPNSVISIGAGALYGCSSLTELNVPNSVTSIGDNTFSGCSGLTEVTIPNSVKYVGNRSFYGCSGLTLLTIGNSVTFIGNFAFSGCSGLTEIIIPNSVTSIGGDAFAACSGLTEITIPNSVKYVGNRSFYGCSGLTGTLTIPNSVTTIGESAFQDCSGLTSVTIGNSVTSIGNKAFSGCSGLTSVIWNAQSCDDFTYSENPFSSAKTSIQSFTFGDVVEKIPAYLCYQMTGMTSLTLGNSVTTIGDNAFRWCSSLTTVNFPNSVIAIGFEAFRNCDGLTGTLTIPNSVTTIGESAFQDCSGLTSVTIGNSIRSIGHSAFYLINSSVNDRTLILCGGVETIGANSFGTYSSSSRNFTTIVLKDAVVKIKNLGVNPTEIYTYATIPPECDNNSFKSYDATLHVPASAMAAYFAAPYWQNFTNIMGDAVEPTSLTLSADTAYVELGSQLTLQSTLFPSNAINVGMQWTTSDPSIATVNNGIVSALKPGDCDITVTCADLVAQCHVVVLDQQITITLDHHELVMEPNTIQWLTPSFDPISTDITASSSNTDVALIKVINNRLQVLAVQPGQAVMTVRSVNGNAVPDSCVVTVLDPSLYGDVNNDGHVDISDVNIVINVMLGFDIPTGNQGGNLAPDDSEQTSTYDLNGDGCVDIVDVNIVINAMLGKYVYNNETVTVNGVSFKMVHVKGGTFTMGATEEQLDEAKPNEKPAHEVTLSDFSIGQTEVTQELWQAVMGSNPSAITGDPLLPVEQVSWIDCQVFVRVLNVLTGQNFRLPTEAEWEYAARGGSKSHGYKYAGGNTPDEVMWYDANSNSSTHPVATKQPNELGLYDMSGNVWEWCQDWFGDFTEDAQVNPQGPVMGEYRINRGGSYYGDTSYCRVSRRNKAAQDATPINCGLRLAK